jgi:dihydrofolate synthase/folylpolyglutamate synthase
MSESAEEREYARAAELVAKELEQRLGESAPQPRLEATRRVVELLGDVHRSYPVIQVAGTNGKTSTSRLIEAILRAYGLRTGLFTSPHLISFNERIQIDGDPIANDKLVENWVDIKPYVEMVDKELEAKGEPRLTYFEVLTILAFASFSDAPVDVAVVEVGLGGEWDSTNVADAVVAVFTPIDLDHMDRLGSTIDEIARTKSGIIKPSAIVVSAAQVDEVVHVLEHAVELTESPLVFVGVDVTVESTVAVGGQMLTIKGTSGEYNDLFLGLYGGHQAQNAALAIAAVESFLGGSSISLDPEVLTEAFASVESPGRLQLVAKHPSVLVDAAHNPHGAKALAQALESYFTFDEVVLVFSALQGKDARGILAPLAPHVTRVIVTEVNSPRATSTSELARIAADVAGAANVEVIADSSAAVAKARALVADSDRGAVLVAGSIVLVGEVMAEAAATKGWTK